MVLTLSLTTMAILVGVSTQNVNCDNSQTAFTLPCNRNLDPWKAKRTKLDKLAVVITNTNGSSDAWSRLKAGSEKVNTIVEAIDTLSDSRQTAIETFKKKVEKAAEDATETVEKVAETAKKSSKWLQRGAKVLGALVSAVQFLGPIMDIVLLFAPKSKSNELKAIESGFAKMGAKIDSVSYTLKTMQGASDWNSVVTRLIEFEGKTRYASQKYKTLAQQLKASNGTQELSLVMKGKIEDLVNAIRNSGDIGGGLNMVESMFKGTSAFLNGQTLLDIYVRAVNNDCSKILPMSGKLIALVKDAQRLQYFYEINQKLVEPDDDNGYPKAIYRMYKDSVMAYQRCTQAAATHAEEVSSLRSIRNQLASNFLE